MAFSADGFVRIAGGAAVGTGAGSSKGLYFYATDDDDTDIEGAAYFDATDLTQGDVLIASLGVGGTEEVKIYTVSVGTGDKDSNDVTIVAMAIA